MTKLPVYKNIIEDIEINRDDLLFKDQIFNSNPSGFSPNVIFKLEDLPIPINKPHSFNNFNQTIIKNNSVGLPDCVEKGINNYVKIIEDYRDTKYPNLSIEKAINRELKKNKKKINMCRIIKKKKTVSFK